MRLLICSKSTWHPAIRREHAIARSAAADGDDVVFVERALDVRALRDADGRKRWLSGLRAAPLSEGTGISLVSQATLIPGHRSELAQRSDALRLWLTLRRLVAAREGTVVVATQPWQWPAVAATPGVRRVFDCADDWRALIPGRAAAFDRLYRRIAAEADAVVLVSSTLEPVFAGGRITVVPNGVDMLLAREAVQAPPRALRLVYAGTLSERFDAPFLSDVLRLLPEWQVELYGQCQYAGGGDRPGAELQTLLDRYPGRATWHDAIERHELTSVLDRARVLIAPHRQAQTRGQDSMKLYDYAARGRAIVCTPGALGSADFIAGAGVTEAADPQEFAAAVLLAAAQEEPLSANREWLQANSWQVRWRVWRTAALDRRRNGAYAPGLA